MKNVTRTVFAAALAALAPTLSAETYNLDSAHSKAQFAVRHMMVSTVRGDFSKVQGLVVFDPKDAATSHVEITIDANSINTGEPQRDGHLKSPDFFDTHKYPTLKFVSTKVVKQAGGKYLLAGNLTMHGVTKPVTLAVEPTAEVKDPMKPGAYRMGATAMAKVNRKDFGLTWNKALETGGVLIGEDVAITIDVELVRGAAVGTK
jgi:polyisoprenoid-binding protein YceI